MVTGILALALAAYTNHAGIAVAGVPVALTARAAVLSNGMETVELPLSAFPPSERRRLVADCVERRPDIGTGRLLVPTEIRRAIEGNNRAVAHVQKRAEKGLCAQEEADDYCRRSRAALRAYLDREEKAGRLLPKERSLLAP